MNNALRRPAATKLTGTNNHQAYLAGKESRRKGHHRVSPYYNEKEKRDGRWVDVTDERDMHWFAGYDGVPEPSLPPAENNIPIDHVT